MGCNDDDDCDAGDSFGQLEDVYVWIRFSDCQISKDKDLLILGSINPSTPVVIDCTKCFSQLEAKARSCGFNQDLLVLLSPATE